MNKVVMNVIELAQYWGIPVGTIRYLTRKRVIPHFRVGKHIRYRLADLEGFDSTAIANKINGGICE